MSTSDVVAVHSMFPLKRKASWAWWSIRFFCCLQVFSEKKNILFQVQYIHSFKANNSRRPFFVFVRSGSWMPWGNGMVPFTEAGVIFYTLDKQEPCAENSVVLMSMVSLLVTRNKKTGQIIATFPAGWSP